MADVTPLFLLSLPRAGSTLLQRILGAHEEIATAAEPWLLLPFLYSLRSEGVYSEYWHGSAASAIADFCTLLPDGTTSYRAAVRDLVESLYAQASTPRARYFLDKTPRYHLVVDELFEMFPRAKFVFLWRNPLSVAASILDTWGGDGWNLHQYRVDLYQGLASLVSAWETHKQRAHAVRYEDLARGDISTLVGLFDYLEIPFDQSVTMNFVNVTLSGRMGDPTGRQRYSALSTEPLVKWRSVVRNPLRKYWCREYLSWIGKSRLDVMGYDLNALRADLDSTQASTDGIFSDLWRLGRGSAVQLFTLNNLKRALFGGDWGRVYDHR